VRFLDEVAETILPETSTPGAKAARTGVFMALMVTDAYTPRKSYRSFPHGMPAPFEADVSTRVRRRVHPRRDPSRDSRCCSGLDAERPSRNRMHSTKLQSARARLTRPPQPADALVHYSA
jgi:hypothetical protein